MELESSLVRSSTVADAARRFVERRERFASVSPAYVHDSCNFYIKALRSGNRRRSHGMLRTRLRVLRAAAAGFITTRW